MSSMTGASMVEGKCISSLSLSKDGRILALCSTSGELLSLHPISLACVPVFHTDSSLVGCFIDRSTDEIYVTNRVEQCIMRGKLQNIPAVQGVDQASGGDGEAVDPSALPPVLPLILFPYLSRFEGRSFIGPTSVAISPIDGEIFFTDGGCEGDSSLIYPSGAVFRSLQGRRQVTPILSHGLQRPTGIAFSKDGCLFVCEQSANRLLRLVPRGGYYTSSVFTHFSGSLGPSAIAISSSRDRIYVSLYEPLCVESSLALEPEGVPASRKPPAGRIVVLNMRGAVVEELATPAGPQLTALCLDARERVLYAAHADDRHCVSIIFSFELPSFP